MVMTVETVLVWDFHLNQFDFVKRSATSAPFWT